MLVREARALRCACTAGRASKDEPQAPWLSSFEARKNSHLRSYGSAGGQEVRIGVATTIQPRRTKMTSLDHTDAPAVEDYATVYVAFELSKAKWMLGGILPGSKKLSRYTIAGGDV